MTIDDRDQQLRDLLWDTATRAGAPSSALLNRDVYDRLARGRHRRRLLATVCSVAVSVGLAVALVGPLSGRLNPPVGPAASLSSTVRPSATDPPTSDVTYDNATSPTQVQIGASYHFNLFTHCGIKYLRFDHRVFRATSPVVDSRQASWPTPMALVTLKLTDSVTLIMTDGQHDPMQFILSHDDMPLCD